MEFRILGPLEVGVDGRVLELGGARQRALLAALLIRRNELVPTDRLLDALYGDRLPATAAKTLQAHVSRLRKTLDTDRIQTRGSGYVLVTRPDELDADRFAQLVDAGAASLAGGDAATARRSLEEALSLWRGPPLDDVAYEGFAQGEIARLTELRAACIESLAEARLALGRHAEVVGELERLVAEQPERERLRAALMLALYRSGRQADALAAYRDGRRVLLDELGVEPGRSLRELEQAILRQDPGLDLPGEPPPAPVAPLPTITPREARKTVTAAHIAIDASADSELDPEAMRQEASRALAVVEAAAARHGGSIEAVSAEGLTIVFGVPVVHEDDALRALRTADEARRQLGALRAGVSTGEVVAGGAAGMAPRTTGAPLLRAAQLAKHAATDEILVDDATARLVREAAAVEPVDDASFRLVEIGPDAPRAPGRFTSPMVGREREHRRLADAFEQSASDRSCQLFTVLGTAGVGKSRLVGEFLMDVEGRATVTYGRCLPYGEGITYWPVVEVVRELAGLDEAQTPEELRVRLAALVEGSPDADAIVRHVARTIGSSDAVAAVDESARAVRELLETVAADRPLVVVFDDVHWGEETFLDLVESIADWSRAAPILLLCMARPELLDRRPGWGGGKLNATSVLLEPLSAAECARLIENLVGETDLANQVRTRIAETAEGNPLFVEEMLSMLVDEGLLVRQDGGWAATGDLSHVPVPPTIQALLAARLDQLESEERLALEAAAVEGHVFHEGSVRGLTGSDAVQETLARLVRKELVRPEPPAFAGERGFRFRHLLIRDAAYEAIPKETRAALHERHATWLEQAGGERVAEYEEILGYHLEQAFRYATELRPADESARLLGRRAAELLGAAGRRAFLRSDAYAGVNLVSRAVALLPASDPLRVDLVPNVRAVQGIHDLGWAETVLTDAVEAAATSGDRALAAHALVQRGLLRLFTGAPATPQELVDVAKRAIAVFDQERDQLGLTRAWRLVAQANYLGRRVADSATASEHALVHARLAGDEFEEREVVEWLVIALLLGPAPGPEAVARCELLLRDYPNDGLVQAEILGSLAPLYAMQRLSAEADEALMRSRRIMEQEEQWVWIVPLWLSMVHVWRGEPTLAEEELRPGYEMLKRIGERSHFSSLTHGLADATYQQGRYDEAERLTHECEEACRPNDVHSHILWRSIRAKLLARRQQFDEAEALAGEALDLAGGGDFLPAHAGALEDYAKVLHMAGRADEARAALERSLALYEQKVNLLGADRVRALLDASA